MPISEQPPHEAATPQTVNYLPQAQHEGDDWFEDAILRALRTHNLKQTAPAK